MCKRWLCLLSGLGFIVSSALMADSNDPTKPPNYLNEGPKKESTEITHFVLDEIIISDENKIAIINNRVVKVGDKIGDSVVKKIDSNSVVLAGPQGETVLNLFGNPIKEPAK